MRGIQTGQLQALCSALIANAASDFDVNPGGFTGRGGGLQIQLGNPDLGSESGETWTLGTVFRSPSNRPLAPGLAGAHLVRLGYSPWTTGASTNLAAADLVGRRYTVTASMNF